MKRQAVLQTGKLFASLTESTIPISELYAYQISCVDCAACSFLPWV